MRSVARSPLAAIALVMLGLAWPGAARAATAPTPTITSVKSGHWNEPGTWSAKRVPNGGDDVLISSTVQVDPSAVFVNSLQFQGFGFVEETGALGPWSISVGLGGLWASTGNPSELNYLKVPTSVTGPTSLSGTFSTDTLTLDGPSTIAEAGVVVNHGAMQLLGQIHGTPSEPSVNAADGTITLTGHLPTMTNAGTIDVPAGASPELVGTLTNEAGGHLDVGAGADISDPFAEGRCSTCAAIVMNGGELTGTGLIEAGVGNNGGTVSPGGDGTIGTLTIADGASGYRQGAGGTLRLDVHGTAAGTTMDQLVVGGAVTLGGSLYIDSSGYSPAAGVDHPVLQAYTGNALREGFGFSASVSGAFASLAGPGAASFEAQYPGVAAMSCVEPSRCTGVDLRATRVTPGGGGTGAGGGTPGSGAPVGGGAAGAGGVSAAALVALASAAAPKGKLAAIKAILAHHGYTATFRAPGAGVLSASWYLVPGGVHLAARKPTLVASATAAVTAAGAEKVTLRLTRAGRSLLLRAKKLSLVAKVSFTPAGGAQASITRPFAVQR